MELNIHYPRKIAVVFGGRSTEHDASIFSFKNFYMDIQDAGDDEKIKLSTIYYVMRDGKVLVSPVDMEKPAEFYFNLARGSDFSTIMEAFAVIKENSEFAYLICDGPVGTDGRFISIAENYNLKGTFGSPLSFNLCKSKFHLDRFVASNYPEIEIPYTVYISSIDEMESHIAEFAHKKIVVKPNSLGSSILVSLFEEGLKENKEKIKALVKKIFEYDSRAIIQEYIPGDEYGCYCLEKNGEIEILAIKKFMGAALMKQTKVPASRDVQDYYH